MPGVPRDAVEGMKEGCSLYCNLMQKLLKEQKIKCS